MTHLPPDDDLPSPPPPHEEEEVQYPADFPYAQEPSQEHAFQSHKSSRESSGFGFIALIAGLLCLAALSGIVIYSLLLAPSPPRQPILIEAEGTTKQAPAEAQVKPEPNSNVGIFRMLRGTDQDQQNADATQPWGQIPQNADKNTPLIVKPDAPQETDADESNTEAEQQQTEKSSQGNNQGSTQENKEEKEKTGEKTPPKEPSDNKDATPPKQQARQDTASVSNAWYVQIAALESRAATDKAWAKLHDQLPELLYTQSYVAKAATLASGKRVWRLLLGPQPQQQAETLCRELKTRAHSCLVKKIAP